MRKKPQSASDFAGPSKNAYLYAEYRTGGLSIFIYDSVMTVLGILSLI